MMIPVTIFAFSWMLWFLFFDPVVAAFIFAAWWAFKEWRKKKDAEFELRPDVIADRKEKEARDAYFNREFEKRFGRKR